MKMRLRTLRPLQLQCAQWLAGRNMSQGFFRTKVPFPAEEMGKGNPTPVREKVLEKYKSLNETALQGGGPKGIERHVVKNKKVLIRDRVKSILDPDAEFVEIGKLAGFDMIYGDLACAGVTAGIGKVCGTYCLISGNDATVKAGTYYPITVKKSGRVQDIARMNRLPVIYIPDSGGAFLPLQSQIFIHGGRGFYNQAVMSSEGIAQIAVVCGSCTAGGAYNPTMSDEAIIVDRIGKIFLGGPPLVKAATGEVVTDEELGGAFMHSSVSGCTDYYATNEADAFRMCREIVESLNMNSVPEKSNFQSPTDGIPWEVLEWKSHYEKVELYGILSGILDGSCFKEFKAFYGPGLIVGTGYMEGNMVGLIANCDEIQEAEGLKAAHFIDMCSRRKIPLVFLQNSTPQGSQTGHNDSASLKARSSMAAAAATSDVPKISVNISSCLGDDNILMCGPGFNPNLNLAWPGSQFSAFSMNHTSEPEVVDAEIYDAFGAAHNMIVDTIITPEETRKVLSELLRIVSQQSHNVYTDSTRRSVLRM